MKFAQKIKSFFSAKPNFSPEMFDDLCDLLIEGDFGALQAEKMVAQLRDRSKKEATESLSLLLATLLEEELMKTPVPSGYPPFGQPGQATPAGELSVVLLLGINGVGKTTSAAKLANLYAEKCGLKPILAAGDTFRAAAIDQLKIHGQRLGARVVAHQHGGDPAAVVYDAVEAALAGGTNLIIADTAGRMHTKTALVEELKKIDRVIATKAPAAKIYRYQVLDATTGRNALAQAEIFHEAVKLDGFILTKFDSTAKGGVVFSLATDLKVPVVYICAGEKYSDIDVFNPRAFAREFAGVTPPQGGA
ncbi:MAG: signal recognition particle-docking protein FtsY [Spirochaetes bacterium]|nr:signal recognition particle-docking protein FtsY [Spirochaetota bacterium]